MSLAKAQEVWNVLLERAQGDEDRFRRYLTAFQGWAEANDSNHDVRLAAKAIRFRLIAREGRPLCRPWGTGP